MDRLQQSPQNRLILFIKRSVHFIVMLKSRINLKAKPLVSSQDIPDFKAIREVVGEHVDLEIQHLKVYLLGKPLFLRGKLIPRDYFLHRPLVVSDLRLLPQPIFFTLTAAIEHCRFRRDPVGIYCLYVPEMAILGDNSGLRIVLHQIQQEAIERVYPAIQYSKTFLQNPLFNQKLQAKTQLTE
ncbi:MAG: hypothetical protein K0R12_846 [Gammaproteobacteria bacterium]|jgi:hypothetical protein|nr:hypothetical protein [Gammaproteobacteria bacterium]